MIGPYFIQLISLLLSSIAVVQSGVCSFEVQDGCSCKMDDALISVNCVFNETSNTTGPLITSNITESVRLNFLNISNNNLMDLPPDFFKLILSVSHLDLSDNRFTSNPTPLAIKENIEKLNLSHNQFSKLTMKDFVEMTSLKDLDVSYNQIMKIENDVFSTLKDSLLRMSLSGNRISYVNPEAFGHLENLRYLDLSDNPALSDMSEVKFPPHIAHLDLENCGLSDVQDCVLATYRDLQFLGLADNNLTCSCHLSWLYNWQKTGNTYPRPTGQKDPKWTCLDSTGKLVNVSYDPTTCNITGHLQHCRPRKTVPIDPGSFGLDITVEASDTVIVAKWTLTTDLVIHGFVVTYDGEETTKFESPLLKSSVKEYEIQGVKISGSYAVCVHILLNETYTVKKVCQHESSTFLQMIIGILAGIVFLIPCVVALAYILYKDYKVMQSPYDYLYDAENPEVKGDKVNGDSHEVKGHNVNEVKGVEVSVIRVPSVEATKKQATGSQMTKGDHSVTNLGFISDHHKSVPLKSTENINTKL